MAMITGHEPILNFDQWYKVRDVDSRDNSYRHYTVHDCGSMLVRRFEKFRMEVEPRLENYRTLEKLADNEVIHPKADLPNVSSGETAGLVRRIARNLVQNTPNVEIISIFDDDDVYGIFAKHILTSKIIGSDQYSNDMQQNLFASAKTALTLGFDTVIPCLLMDAGGSWYMKYDTIHYRDVFPEPGCKDVREASNVFIRRYLTKGEVLTLCRTQAPGWDHNALYTMLKADPPSKRRESVDQQNLKHKTIPEGYEIITWYSDSGEPFLTFEPHSMLLLRIEKNKHPLKKHPVFFLVLEKDSQQPFGKSQVELLIGRQDFQDLMLNGAMKLWYRNINPSILGFGTGNAMPNLSPGKFTQISNPNAKIEAFEVNTQSLMQYGQITEQNMGSMVNLLGNADQQMAAQAGNGMSATPQGVEAQQTMIDVTQNNYQKAVEGFFSHYCSYALTIYFQELKALDKVIPTAETRIKLMRAGLQPYSPMLDEEGNEVLDATTGKPVNEGHFNEDGTLEMNFKDLATEYWVRCVPGSLVEMEDEKQLRILNELFIPLSQAMQAIAATGDQGLVRNSALTLQYIMQKQLELSGSSSAPQLSQIWETGDVGGVRAIDKKIDDMEVFVGGQHAANEAEFETNTEAIIQLKQQMSQLVEFNQELLKTLNVGGSNEQPGTSSGNPEVAV